MAHRHHRHHHHHVMSYHHHHHHASACCWLEEQPTSDPVGSHASRTSSSLTGTIVTWNKRHPENDGIEAPIERVQQAGDVLVLPARWMHCVVNEGDVFGIAVQANEVKATSHVPFDPFSFCIRQCYVFASDTDAGGCSSLLVSKLKHGLLEAIMQSIQQACDSITCLFDVPYSPLLFTFPL